MFEGTRPSSDKGLNANSDLFTKLSDYYQSMCACVCVRKRTCICTSAAISARQYKPTVTANLLIKALAAFCLLPVLFLFEKLPRPTVAGLCSDLIQHQMLWLLNSLALCASSSNIVTDCIHLLKDVLFLRRSIFSFMCAKKCLSEKL